VDRRRLAGREAEGVVGAARGINPGREAEGLVGAAREINQLTGSEVRS
jgi:hypothetical protein